MSNVELVLVTMHGDSSLGVFTEHHKFLAAWLHARRKGLEVYGCLDDFELHIWATDEPARGAILQNSPVHGEWSRRYHSRRDRQRRKDIAAKFAKLEGDRS